MRLQKLLASAGLGSRRSVEDWIRAGRVTVGGRVARLGDQASAADDVRLDGVRLELQLGHTSGTLQVLLYYKPAGEVTTRRDPEGRPTVFERLPQPKAGRWINVGRLDVNTSGLLLFTTDGELAHRLMHPSSAVEREYLVRLRGEPGPAVLRQLQEGVRLADGPGRFDLIVADRAEHTDRAGRGGELRGARAGAGAGRARGGGHSSFRVVLREGRNREVRRMFEAVGFEVSRLLRNRYGPIELPRDLRPGGARLASPEAVERLLRAAAPEAEPGTRQGGQANTAPG
ncbi:MAG TPA: pseudouridine synthase [Steroidobacteraceae bacterium]|nr:pseudouridine synthase [Steroidobacteraceae bacterium]